MQRLRRHRFDTQSIRQFLSRSPNTTNLVDQCLQTIRFVAAQVTNTNHVCRLISKHQNRRQRGRNLPGRRQIERTQPMHGAVMETYADHRMATFAAMLGLRIPDIEVINVATTRKTLPDFVGMWSGMLRQ